VEKNKEENLKQSLDFPDKYYCKCGKEISESEMSCVGMCDNCYSLSLKKSSIGECNDCLEQHPLNENGYCKECYKEEAIFQ
jgi:hypothetical protein